MKSYVCVRQGLCYMSLPLRECGLKCAIQIHKIKIDQSLPLRECGLKLSSSRPAGRELHVTPFAGVWIEILPPSAVITVLFVTPFAGVWIEICVILNDYTWPDVTPFAGVWIEIQRTAACSSGYVSLPLRECGLKYQIRGGRERAYLGHSLCGSVD